MPIRSTPLGLVAAISLAVGIGSWTALAASGPGGLPDQAAGLAGQAQPAGGRGGQAPIRDTATQQSPLGTGSITGSVASASTGAPVRRARITLSGAELRGGRSALTDDQGRFNFQSLPAGRFTMTASKAGFVDIAYGAKRPGRPGTPIQLAEGQKLDKVNIGLPRGSIVTGVVIDENGEPSPGTPVRVMRYVIRTGEKTLQQAGQDQTDDRGMYRIYGLQPGDYMVSAAPRNTNAGELRQTIMAEVEALMQQAQGQGGRAGGPGGGRGGGGLDPGGRGGPAQQLIDRASALQQQLTQNDQEQAVAYAPVYYPGTTSPSAAQTVTLGIAEERGGVDFQLQLVPTARVDGSVLSPSGTLPAGVQVALSPADRAGLPSIPGVGLNMTRVGQDGTFSFQGVTPGQYTLQARATIRDPAAQQAGAGGGGGGRGQGGPGGRGGPGGPGQVLQVLWASVDVGVGGTNLTGLVLNLQPGMTISGHVDFQGAAQPPADLRNVRVSISPRGQQTFELGGIPQAQVDATGHFTFAGVPPGRYVLSGNAAAGGPGQGGGQARGAGPGQAGAWSLKSVVAGGRDALDFPLEIAPNQDVSGVVMQFTDRTQELSGTIQDAAGRPISDFTIIVFPSDSRFWLPQARRIVSSRPGTDGRFTMRNLPPGDYRLAAVTDVEPGEWYDPAFLSQLAQASIAVSIAEGDKKVQDIKFTGGGV